MKKFLLSASLMVATVMTLSAATIGDTYSLVSTTSELESGAEYILASGTTAMGAHSGKFFANVDNGITVSNNVATIANASVQTFNLVSNGSSYNFIVDGKYLTFTSSNATMNLGTDASAAAAKFTITFVNNLAKISTSINSTDWSLQYNSSTPRFGNYKNTQVNCSLYKKTTGSVNPSTPVAYNAPFNGQSYTLTVGETLTPDRGNKYPSAMVFILPEGQESLSENDDTFTLTALAEGTVKVEVMWEEDSNFTEGEASFTVTVNPKPETPTPGGEEVTGTYVPKDMGYANQDVVNEAKVDDITFTFAQASGSNPPAYYNTGNALRLYGGNTATISVPEGCEITKIEFTFDSGETAGKEMTANVGNYSNNVWTGSNQEVIFTVASGSGHKRIASVTVTYLQGDAPVVAAPTISCTDNQVTITCATDNAKIYYTTDGNEPSNASTEYTAPFAIEKNTTVKAIAYVGSEASNVTTYNAVYTVNGTITVAKALELIENGYNSTATVKGYITKIDEISTSYGNATYYIADEKGGSTTLEVYRGYWMNGNKFTAGDEIAVDGLITVEGTLVNFNGTYEFSTGSKVIDYEAPEGGGDEPIDPNPPTGNSLVQNFNTGLGFPEASANVPKTPTQYTATDTGITYTIMGCYANSGYLMMNSKNYTDAFISWTLNVNLDALTIKTSNGGSTKDANAVNFWVKPIGQEEFIKVNQDPIALNVQNADVRIEVPYDYRGPGTTYKVQYNAPVNASDAVNSQFVSFTYGISTGVESVISDSDATPVYYNLQGVKVANPEKGLYIMVKGNKATKVIF